MSQNWFYLEGNKVCGPVPQDKLFKLLAEKKLDATSMLSQDGSESWQPAGEWPIVKSYMETKHDQVQANDWILLKLINNQYKQFGPFTTLQIHKKLSAGECTWDDYIWRDGMTDWQAIGGMQEFVNKRADKMAAKEEPPATPAKKEPVYNIEEINKIPHAELLKSIKFQENKKTQVTQNNQGTEAVPPIISDAKPPEFPKKTKAPLKPNQTATPEVVKSEQEQKKPSNQPAPAATKLQPKPAVANEQQSQNAKAKKQTPAKPQKSQTRLTFAEVLYRSYKGIKKLKNMTVDGVYFFRSNFKNIIKSPSFYRVFLFSLSIFVVTTVLMVSSFKDKTKDQTAQSKLSTKKQISKAATSPRVEKPQAKQPKANTSKNVSEKEQAPTYLNLQVISIKGGDKQLKIGTNASSHYPLNITIHALGGEILKYPSIYKTMSLPPGKDVRLSLKKLGLPDGRYDVIVESGSIAKYEPVFVGRKNKKFLSQLSRHKKKISYYHQREKENLLQEAGRLRDLSLQIGSLLPLRQKDATRWQRALRNWQSKLRQTRSQMAKSFKMSKARNYVHSYYFVQARELENNLVALSKDPKASKNDFAAVQNDLAKFSQKVKSLTLWP